jgi:hypothetical protein
MVWMRMSSLRTHHSQYVPARYLILECNILVTVLCGMVLCYVLWCGVVLCCGVWCCVVSCGVVCWRFHVMRSGVQVVSALSLTR